ncbi:hypothetical protein EDM52_22255 [Brevibacillus invocatus]|uniref:Uncharacterized protein n=1 Tax=Brevibacillus invocatus TaxID=173959 RepID=A0A3M8BVL2_9BACL|nr:hypothetical protein [Brevibacillus invocatus]RNB67481.1 hypothetical protein EDM52_22255 [Brevibacillus invocatus]
MSERDSNYEGRDAYDMDVDRMINEGLGGGMVSYQNGLVEETSVDTMQGESGQSGGSAARQALNDDDESVT